MSESVPPDRGARLSATVSEMLRRTEKPALNGDRRGYTQSLCAEIRMLLDYLAANSSKTLVDVKVKDPKDTTRDLQIGEILARLDDIEEKIQSSPPMPLDTDEFAFLQLLRDAVSRLANPASGLTVAYTAMVSGNFRNGGATSRTTLAQQAYPGLISTARWHRRTQVLFLLLAVLVTGAAVWESAKVALGKSLLQNLDALRSQQTSIAAEKVKLETMLDKPADGQFTPVKLLDTNTGQISMAAFSLCNRPMALAYDFEQLKVGIPPELTTSDAANRKLKLYSSPAERDVCERDSVLLTNFEIVHHDLVQYQGNWPSMVGSVFQAGAWVMNFVESELPVIKLYQQEKLSAGHDDVEFTVAPALLVWGNYVLPVIFGLLGALIFVILEFYNKSRNSLLDPRDRRLCWIRLVLGLVTGACIGLFFSSYGPAAPGPATNLISSLTLSASGLAFLAGFGVEGVFSMLQALVARVFASDAGQK